MTVAPPSSLAWLQLQEMLWARLPRWLSGKESAYQCRRLRKGKFNSWVGRSPEGGNGNPLQYSCLENPMDRGAWWATLHGVTKSQTWLGTHAQNHQLSWSYTPDQQELWKISICCFKLQFFEAIYYVITDKYNDYQWVVLHNIASEQGTHFLDKKVCQWAHAHWVYWLCQVETPSEAAELIKEPDE